MPRSRNIADPFGRAQLERSPAVRFWGVTQEKSLTPGRPVGDKALTMSDSANLPDYEKLGLFYLGREVDPASGETTPVPLLYDSRNLTTHAVCVGMTGSGKTGLCLSLLEEAAIDGVPAIAIDPKGDVGNLLLTFPELRPEDFRPWIDEAEARREGVTPDELAAETAERWRSGLADWGQGPDRIARLRESADFRIYTPGSSAGLPVSVLSSLAAPGPGITEESELLAERVTSVATSLLTLLGRSSDPVQSREHVLLSTLLDRAWREGRDLDLAGLIHAIQDPPFERVGVLDLESFYPKKERLALAMAFNNLLAAPGFAPWLEGIPLDPDRLLYTSSGKPRVAVLSIAHLSEAERMFFVTLLLTELIAWMRKKQGTESLRAILYMDELFGYLPPVAEPPSKRPFLTLLKQARAYGLGLVLASQNPIDLDYKALSNAGTWMLGRLQTEQDQNRVVDGLVGASPGGLDRRQLQTTLGSLGKRVFLLHDVRAPEPRLFQTRWALSYLAGPMTRQDIERVMAGVEPEAGEAVQPAAAPAATVAAPAPPGPAQAAPAAPASSGQSRRPALPDGIPEVFLPTPPGAAVAEGYRPALLGLARVHYLDRKLKIEHDEELALLTEFTGGAKVIDWRDSEELAVREDDLSRTPENEAARFAPLPEPSLRAANYKKWSKDLDDHLYHERPLTLFRSPLLGEVSAVGEDERAFRIRMGDRLREERSRRIDALNEENRTELDKLDAKIRRAQEKAVREASQVGDKKRDAFISAAATIGAALFGRKKLSLSTLGRATTTMRGAGRISKEAREAEVAQEQLDKLMAEREALLAKHGDEARRLADELDAAGEKLETIEVTPRRTDVRIDWVGLVWVPEGSA